MTIRRSVQWVLAIAMLAASTGTVVFQGADHASAVLGDFSHFAPTQGNVNGQVSAYGSSYRDHNSQMIWSTTTACDTSSRLWNFCSGLDDDFEHEIWLNNYHEFWPEGYRWAHWNQGYASNLPSPYLDVPDSDPAGEWGITVGSVSAPSIQANTWYYANVVSDADYSGPNYYKLKFSVGDTEWWGCLNARAWCMLSEDDWYIRIPFSNRYTFPNHLYSGGP